MCQLSGFSQVSNDSTFIQLVGTAIFFYVTLCLSLWQLLKSYTNPDFRFSLSERTIHPVDKNRSKKAISPQKQSWPLKISRGCWVFGFNLHGLCFVLLFRRKKLVPFIKYFRMCGTWDKLAVFVHWMKAEIKIQMRLTMRQSEIPGPTLMVPSPNPWRLIVFYSPLRISQGTEMASEGRS